MALERWTRCSNYMGEDFSDYYVVSGQNRDSSYIQQSNFIAATKRLGGEMILMITRMLLLHDHPIGRVDG